MRERKNIYLKLLSDMKAENSINDNTQSRITAIEVMAQIEEIQGINDDLIESITAQNESLEGVIQKLLEGGVAL